MLNRCWDGQKHKTDEMCKMQAAHLRATMQQDHVTRQKIAEELQEEVDSLKKVRQLDISRWEAEVEAQKSEVER